MNKKKERQNKPDQNKMNKTNKQINWFFLLQFNQPLSAMNWSAVVRRQVALNAQLSEALVSMSQRRLRGNWLDVAAWADIVNSYANISQTDVTNDSLQRWADYTVQHFTL